MSTDTRVALAKEMQTAGRDDPALLRRLVGKYLRLRKEHNDLTKRRAELSDQLLPLLEAAGGRLPIRSRGVEVYIDARERYEYKPDALHGLVDAGLLTEDQFAAALKMTVVKAMVEAWVKTGLVTESDIARTGAQTVPQVERQIRVRNLPAGRQGSHQGKGKR